MYRSPALIHRVTQPDNNSQPTRGEVTRLRLLNHACREFARLGFHSTKVSNIVKASGLSQPTFYIYFDSKEAAYEELVHEFRRRLRVITKDLLIQKPIGGEALVKSLQYSFIKFLSFLAEEPNLTEIGLFQPPGCTDTKASLVLWIAENIAQEQELGVFSKDVDALTIARCFVGMIDQAARVPRDELPLEELAMGCARVLCTGIGR
ncbi:TetR/AcrR family transcriptional regulator [Pantoea endophytica]|uniref:TetR/AcrR family transcriptional regulator n=1 Tax=Pantoea endophytica TaxID=92488 RepID=UPI0035E3EA51